MQPLIPELQHCIFLAGPTASGKSAMAIRMAEAINGEIISVDSMQVYRGIDIGSAKPSLEEQNRVPHHLIDVLSLAQPFDAAQFVHRAVEAMREIISRKHTPIFSGGTGLYFKALMFGLGESPPADPSLRLQLESTPISLLLEELSHLDPPTFASVDRNNPRRIIRAVEVIRLTGRPFSSLKAAWKSESAADGTSIRGVQSELFLWVLQRETPDLYARINTRVDRMFQQGLVEETTNLLARGLIHNKTAMQAIGYRQVVEHLQNQRDLDLTIELIKQKTRQYAKRQMTWFRHQMPARWLKLMPGDDYDAPVSILLEAWKKSEELLR